MDSIMRYWSDWRDTVLATKEMALRSRLYNKDLHAILDQFDQQKQRINEAFNTRKGELGFMENGHDE
jgi:hypothetical protein